VFFLTAADVTVVIPRANLDGEAGAVGHAAEAPLVAADGRSLARALRVSGKVDPVFVDLIDDLPQVIT
jgi:hypothetical protein